MEWLLGLVALGLACAIWGIGIERHLYRVRETQIKDALPAGSESIRVLHVSDIHLAPWQRRKSLWVSKLVRLEPDLIVNTGDNMSHRNAVDAALEMLEPLQSVPGVFVNGSNDYHAPTFRNPFTYLFAPSRVENGALLDTERFVETLADRGWLNLNNRGGELNIRGLKVGFLGLDDPHDRLDDVESLGQQRTDAAGSDLTIGVVHAPYLRIIEALTVHDASVIFAGHTHGGQLCLPGKGALVTNCDLPTRYAKGLSGWEFAGKRSIVNVCAGLGTSIFAPVRFFCLPEVRLVTLLAKSE
jgi:predicted MPP superfamily phosphohydrolase